MKTIKVSEATGQALDWLVAKCEGQFDRSPTLVQPPHFLRLRKAKLTGVLHSSTDWAQGGPLIEREKIDCIADPNGKDVWMGQLYATRLGGQCVNRGYGPTPLIAAMRCLVCSKLGDVVEVPEELF